jgi:hypothetical protein
VIPLKTEVAESHGVRLKAARPIIEQSRSIRREGIPVGIACDGRNRRAGDLVSLCGNSARSSVF